ncbi:hypothetical protein [Streptomyces otsuchiensis]|uniref:hypothetical protein n=1 Tax=Streptomyces otsuchiensis TaxID=2681388 RepID=UPI0010309308|nr:hypothetical protein [Streptomyces otsuchiensis]
MTWGNAGAGIPHYTGDLGELERATTELARLGRAIDRDGTQVHATFQGLQEYYDAPEAPELLSSTEPVRDMGALVGEAFDRLGSLLAEYTSTTRVLDDRLTVLRERAARLPSTGDFVTVATTGGPSEHDLLAEEVAATVAEYRRAEQYAVDRVRGLLDLRGPAHAEHRAAMGATHRFLELADQRHLTPAEIAELDAILEAHSGDAAFALYTMDRLGVEGLLDLAARVEIPGERDHHRSPMGPTLTDSTRAGLGDILAVATRVPPHLRDIPPEDPRFIAWLASPAGRRWERWTLGVQLRGGRAETAPSPYAFAGDQPTGRYGYHDVLALMEKARQPFGAQFMDSVVGDIVSREQRDSTFRPAGMPPSDRSLLDVALGISAKDPAAAAMILDPERGNTLDYALERAGTVEGFEKAFGGTPSTDHTGLARAMEAAATGLPSGLDIPDYAPPPNETNARVAQHLVNHTLNETLPKTLTPTVANVAALYIGDINHAMISAEVPQFEHGLDLDRASSEHLLRVLSKDPAGADVLLNAQLVYVGVTAEYFASDHTGISPEYRTEAFNNAAESGGRVAGIIASEKAEHAFQEISKPDAENMKRFTQHLLTGVSDATIGQIPGFGTASANEMVKINEALWKDHEEQKNKDAAEAARNAKESTSKSIKAGYVNSGSAVYDPTKSGANKHLTQTITEARAQNGFEAARTSHEYWHYR